MDQRPSIAIYLQHYLSPSMTFIYRQLKILAQDTKVIVLCSDRLENLDMFPYDDIFFKSRNFIRFKKSKYYKKLFGNHTLLNTNPRISVNQKKYFKKLILQFKIDIIHAHFGPSGLEIVNLAREMALPLVVTFHGFDASILLKMTKYRQNLNRIFEYCHVIAVSENMKKDLIIQGAKEDRISVIRCGIPLDKFEFLNKVSLKEKFERREEIIFLQVANFVEVKGHKYTLEAFCKFNKTYPESKLILAGDGPLRLSILDLIKNLDLANVVELPGIVTESVVLKLMEDADVFLSHSVELPDGTKEGLPTVLMEAMARGLIVISSKHSAIPELVVEGFNGYLVPERDLNLYYSKMLKLKESTQEIRYNARETIAKEFSLTITSQRLKSLYMQLVDNRHTNQ